MQTFVAPLLLVLVLLLAPQTALAQPSFNCSRNGLCHEQLQRLRIQEVQKTILSELRMPSSPNFSITEEQRREYERMAKQMLKDSDDEFEEEHVAYTSELFPGTDASHGKDPTQLMATFEIPARLMGDSLIEAKLVFHVNMPDNPEPVDVEVQVIEMDENGYQGDTVTAKVFSASHGQRLELVLPLGIVKRWYTDSPIGGLFVSAFYGGRNVVTHPQESKKVADVIYMKVTTSLSTSRSKRKAVPTCDWVNPSEGCCLYDLLVDFERIGWDWIIAPKRYNAFVCRGDCRLNHHHFAMAENGHTKVVKVADRMAEGMTAKLMDAGYCCHPTEYDYLKMIYINRDGRISIGNVNGMVARRCSCS